MFLSLFVALGVLIMSSKARHGNDIQSQLHELRLVKEPDTPMPDNQSETPPTSEDPEVSGGREKKPTAVQPPTVRYTETDKGETTVSIPASMPEAAEIAKQIIKLQSATRWQKYGNVVSDALITSMSVVGGLALVVLAVKGWKSGKD